MRPVIDAMIELGPSQSPVWLKLKAFVVPKSGWTTGAKLGRDRSPKSDDQSTRDNQESTQQDWDCRHRPEDQEADDLPDDEQRGDVDAHDLVKFERCGVESKAIAEQQYRARQEVGAFDGNHVAAKPYADEGIARHFKRSSNDQQADNEQLGQEGHPGLLASRFALDTSFGHSLPLAFRVQSKSDLMSR